MRRDLVRVGLFAALLAACSSGGADDVATVSTAASAARVDSVRPGADSAAYARYTACADSMTAELKETAAGRQKLAAKLPEGMLQPDILAACGKPPAAPAAAGRAAPDAKAAAAAARADSAKRRETEIVRETFAYGGGVRDPFASLIDSETSGPELVDLQLVGIYQNHRNPVNSVAVVRDKNSGKRYKLRVGDELGRLLVAQIRPKDVVFTVRDFGFERQETLSLRTQEDVIP